MGMATERKPDSICTGCGERVFWAVAGYWIHLSVPLIAHDPEFNEE
jgi:hypothetical protein